MKKIFWEKDNFNRPTIQKKRKFDSIMDYLLFSGE